MEKTNGFKQFINRSLIFNSIVWALALIFSNLLIGEPNEKFNIVLLTCFFLDFLRLSSTKNKLNQAAPEKD